MYGINEPLMDDVIFVTYRIVKSAYLRIANAILVEYPLLKWRSLNGLWVKIALVAILISLIPYPAPATPPVWGTKPVLGYFVFTSGLSEALKTEAGLSDHQFTTLQEITQRELDSLSLLEQDSLQIILDQARSLEQKRAAIQEMGYNLQVKEIIGASQSQLRAALGEDDYAQMVSWINHRWLIEREKHGTNIQPSAGPRTYEVFATRYDANGAYYAALPDQCLKLTNGGSHICEDDGYKVGREYSVYLSYKKSVAARVGEVGPWNIDDNYWAAYNDPTPRRMFADLPLGMPEAQAAYFNGYNGGVDQYGRVVTAPFGIDLSFDVAEDIGLPAKKNDWIQVSYMWTEGWNGGGSSTGGGSSAPAATQVQVKPVDVSTPQADGKVIHLVQSGQTLWEIAVKYQVTLQEIYQLNGFSEGHVIRPGDELLIKTVQKDTTSKETTPTETKKKTPKPSQTQQSKAKQTKTLEPTSSTAQAYIVSATTSSQSDKQSASSSSPSGAAFASILMNRLYILIGFVVVAGLALMLVGTWMNRKN